jgi:hypothetical protein
MTKSSITDGKLYRLGTQNKKLLPVTPCGFKVVHHNGAFDLFVCTRETEALENVYDLLGSSPRWQVSWGVSLTNPVQPVNPQTTCCGCGRTNRLHVFLTCTIRIICRQISLVLVLKISRNMGIACLGPLRRLSVILSPSAKRACRSRIYSICRWARIYEGISSSRLEVFPSVNWSIILSWYVFPVRWIIAVVV